MSLATLNGLEVARLRVTAPEWGAWWVDAECTAEAEDVSGPAALEIAGLELSGAIVAGGTVEGRSRFRVVGGRGGWGKIIPAKAYRDDAGVKVSRVLEDAAREAGETISNLPTTRLGPHYARKEGCAADTLNHLAPQNWYVDFDGVTRIGKRDATEYEGDAPRTRIDPAARVVELATDDLTGLVPGVRVDGNPAATDVEYRLEESRLTARVYSGGTSSRIFAAYEAIFRALFPQLAFAGTWEFRLLAQVGERMTLQPARAASGMPALSGVPVRPGLAGSKATALPGELVLVTFADCDPSRPQVIAHDHAESLAWLGTISIQFGGPAALPVAYQGSTAQCGPFGGAVLLGSTQTKVRP